MIYKIKIKKDESIVKIKIKTDDKNFIVRVKKFLEEL